MNKRLGIILILILLMVGCLLYHCLEERRLSDTLNGTFVCTMGTDTYYISAKENINKFYFHCKKLGVFEEGTCIKIGDNKYELTGDFIGTQNILIQNNKFSLDIYGELHDFTKIEDVPITPYDLHNEYLETNDMDTEW